MDNDNYLLARIPFLEISDEKHDSNSNDCLAFCQFISILKIVDIQQKDSVRKNSMAIALAVYLVGVTKNCKISSICKEIFKSLQRYSYSNDCSPLGHYEQL